jgi:hypothetical protein
MSKRREFDSVGHENFMVFPFPTATALDGTRILASPEPLLGLLLLSLALCRCELLRHSEQPNRRHVVLICTLALA